jgi:sialate O-acetylesterase
MNRIPLAGLLVALAIGPASAPAEVSMPSLFSDHAVLQRDMPVPVWGTSAPGAKIEILWDDDENPVATTVADASGVWQVSIGPLQGDLEYHSLTVLENEFPSVTINNVRVGEVWLGSGQSNMNRPLSGDGEAGLGLADAPHLNLSFFNVASGTPSNALWEPSNGATAESMSAVLFWFGRRLERALASDPELVGLPIGLIHSSVGATAIERWSTVAGSGGLYQEQIQPLQPYAIRGVLWYQGEWDARGAQDSSKYYWQLPALIEEWRADWGQGNFPFYVVQMPRMGINSIHVIRDAELQTALVGVDVEMTVNVDWHEVDVHPSEYRTFGERLANIALRNVHGQDVVAFGPVADPTLSEVVADVLYVGFRHVEQGLATSDSRAPAEWEIAGADGNYKAAEAVLTGDGRVTLSHPEVPVPVFARYAYATAPANPNLQNSAGLPASPIRELEVASSPDLDPPTPANMDWEIPPHATGPTSIAMTAVPASDPSGVEYNFTCVIPGLGCIDSGWQDSRQHENSGLLPATEYDFQVTARDKSPARNETQPSGIASATTEHDPPLCEPAESSHVAAISVFTVKADRGAKRAQAQVVIENDCGQPVENADVRAIFSGDYNEEQTTPTNSAGLAAFQSTDSVKGGVSFMFCVIDVVVGPDAPSYSPDDNVATCATF